MGWGQGEEEVEVDLVVVPLQEDLVEAGEDMVRMHILNFNLVSNFK